MSARTAREKYQAIPTEYKGVCYRSKSEAMFAVWLEMYVKNSPYGLCDAIQYEPKWSTVSGYTFDFAYHRISDLDHFVAHYCDLYEYKPTATTEVYRNNWAKKCSELSKKDSCPRLTFFKLYEGDFYTVNSNSWFVILLPNGDLFSIEKHGPWLDAKTAELIRSIRFDLKDGA